MRRSPAPLRIIPALNYYRISESYRGALGAEEMSREMAEDTVLGEVAVAIKCASEHQTDGRS